MFYDLRLPTRASHRGEGGRAPPEPGPLGGNIDAAGANNRAGSKESP